MKESSNAGQFAKQQKRILIVDEDLDVLLFLKDRLIALGYDVLSTTSGEEGLAILQHHSVDGILLELPVRGGFHLLEQLKQHFPLLPMIIMSTIDHRSAFRKAIRNRPADYLVKPIVPEELISKCMKVFQ